jgi:hypothetical protein
MFLYEYGNHYLLHCHPRGRCRRNNTNLYSPTTFRRLSKSFFDQAIQTYISSIETIWLRALHATPAWGSLSGWQSSESKRIDNEKIAAWRESQLQIVIVPCSFLMRVKRELWDAALASATANFLGLGTKVGVNLPQFLGKEADAAMTNITRELRKTQSV